MPVAKELTELIQIAPKRIDRVKSPATGFPVLIMKSASKDVNPQGGIDETPDIHGAEGVMIQLARLIEAEAREMAVGQWDEVCDIQLLTEAAYMLKCFMHREAQGALEEDGEPVMKDAPSGDELHQAASWVMKRKFSAAERRRLASEGKALPDGSYPIENAEDLHNAAILARSGHGDVAAARRLIAKRAKELGVANPLADAKKETVVDNEVKADGAPGAGEEDAKTIAELVAEAVAKEVAPLVEANKGLADELAALKAKPIPGGPVITAAKSAAVMDRPAAAQAERFDRLSKSVSDRELARYYAERAREAREASR
jgi:hypothetical protein